MKALLVLFFLALLVLGLVHLVCRPAFIVVRTGQPLPSHYLQAWAFGNLVCRPAFIVVRTGQPLPSHYLQAWAFGNLTIVQVAPSHAVVSIGPWP